MMKSQLGVDISRPGLSSRSALVLVDLLRGYADTNLRFGRALDNEGTSSPYFQERLHSVVVPCIKELLRAFRSYGLPIMYVRVRVDDPNAADWPPLHRKHLVARDVAPLGPGDPEFEWIPGLEPKRHEMVVEKHSVSAFATTGIGRLLHNVGAEHLVFCGLTTNYGVGHTAIDSTDHGFLATIVEDGCAATADDVHQQWLDFASDLYLNVATGTEIVKEVAEVSASAASDEGN